MYSTQLQVKYVSGIKQKSIVLRNKERSSFKVLGVFCGEVKAGAELRKVAILAIQDQGTLWESGEHFDQNFSNFCLILG